MSKIAEIFRRAVNDDKMFPVRYEIFNESEWQQLSQLFKERNKEGFDNLIEMKRNAIKQKTGMNSKKAEKDDYYRALQLLDAMKNGFNSESALLREMFDVYKEYGIRWCNLPTMDQYGRIIERKELTTVKMFFQNKSHAENQRGREALLRALDYVITLYDEDTPLEEIAYFVRKLDSLQHYGEAIA